VVTGSSISFLARPDPLNRLVLLVGAGIAGLVMAASWNQVSEHLRSPVPGAVYAVEGRAMHLYCSGVSSPTIVIEAGLGLSWLNSQQVQPQLSKVTRVCSYDRSGLGWSEPRPGSRDAQAVARQLHGLLQAGGVRGPLVLMGHSGGGIYVREYVREFPADVAGVVLVDSATPEQFERLPGFRASFAGFLKAHRRRIWWEKLRVLSGIQRLAGRCHSKMPARSAALREQADAEMCRFAYVGGDIGEYSDFELAARQAARIGSFGSLPLLIISRDPKGRGAGMENWRPEELMEWDRGQEDQKGLSTRSWRVVARGSGHNIYDDRPELVVAEVSVLLRYLRGGTGLVFGPSIVE